MQPIEMPFDLSKIDPYVGGAEPLPSGTYPMAIKEMEVVANNKAETGHNLKLIYEVIEGEFKGRKLYENLNLWHKTSSGAVEIAWKQLSSIGHAVGIVQGNDLTALANKPMMVEVMLEPGKEASMDANGNEIKARGPQNRVVRRDPYSAQSTAQAQPHIPASQPVSAPNAAAAAQAPAFNPAQAQQAQQAPAAAQQAAAQQTQQIPAAPAQAVPTGTPGASTPPWMAK